MLNFYMKALHMVAFILLWIGGLNWLLFAFGYNLVGAIFGALPGVDTLVYVLVGASAVYTLVTHKSYCKLCDASSANKM